MAENKGYGFMDDFIVSLESLIEGLNAAKDAAVPKLEEALQRWVKNVERDAKAKLKRPRWLLQKSITDKVITYEQNKKVWAMVGFRFQERRSKRDPGYYGQFHEAGWAPDRVVKVPHHFLKDAKKENKADLEKELQKALADVIERVNEITRQRRIQNVGSKG